MKSHSALSLIIILLMIFQSGCVSRKKLTYLQFNEKAQEYNQSFDETRPSVTPTAYKIMPYDNLYIRVITPDPQWSAIFNTMPVGAGGAVTEESAALFGYIVDEEGEIEIPFVGKIKVGEKTLTEIKEQMDAIFKNYLTDAAITVRLVNNYISVIGEVTAPGRYRLTKDRVNIFEVLSLAGDLSAYSNRQRIQLIRPSSYGPIIKEFTLTDRSILSSEYYYVMPNDIIYAMPVQGRSFQLNSSVWTLFLTTVTSAFGIIALVRTL